MTFFPVLQHFSSSLRGALECVILMVMTPKLCKSKAQTSEYMSIMYHLWEDGGIVSIFSVIFWLS